MKIRGESYVSEPVRGMWCVCACVWCVCVCVVCVCVRVWCVRVPLTLRSEVPSEVVVVFLVVCVCVCTSA